ncbi:MAG: hypothetical protein IJQ53_02945 [Clostridia bacterium]|nr:hypothetical protein [Clostridia bacterium]
MKKLLSAFLALIIVFTLCGAVASADDEPAFDPEAALGEPAADTQFDIRLNAQLRYKPGDEIKVIATVRNIKHKAGISVLTYDFYYDTEKVELANVPKSDGSLDVDFKTPDAKAWENLTKYATDDNDALIPGAVRVTLANANTASATAVRDGELTVTLRFKVKESADGEIFFWVPHASVIANDADFVNFVGSGSYAGVKKQPTKEDLVSGLEEELKPDPGAQFDLDIAGPDGYNTVRKIDVTVSVKNVKAERGLSGVDFLLKYDAEILELVTPVNTQGVVEAQAVLPNADTWENLTKLEQTAGVIHVAFYNATDAQSLIDGDDKFSVTFSFIGRKDSEFPAGIWTDSASIEGRTADFTVVKGNGCYIVLDKQEYVYVPGDVNGNEKIDARDYAMAKRSYLGTYQLSEDETMRGDINKNNKVDAQDYAMIKRHYLGTYVIPGAEGK